MASEVTTTLHVRIKEQVLDDFRATCKDKYHQDHNDMLRELIVAFNEGRVRITPTEGQQTLIDEVYETPKLEEK